MPAMDETVENDSRAVALYAEALVTGTLPREVAISSLTSLLGSVSHSAPQSEPRTLLYLCIGLVRSEAPTDSAFMAALLGELERAPDPAAEPYVRLLAESWALWKVARPIRKQARRCLAALQRESSRRTDAAVLLRSAEMPTESMVRPAESSRKDSPLLRPHPLGADLL
jgi:hypothetical protein